MTPRQHRSPSATPAHAALGALATLCLSAWAGTGVCLEAKPQAQDGNLQVTSEPVGATVYLDGKLSGRTPVALGSLPAGDHRLTLVAYGHLENHQIVTVVAGQLVTVHVHLAPDIDVSEPHRQPGARERAPGEEAGASTTTTTGSARPARARSRGGFFANKKRLLLIGAPVVVGGGVYLLTSGNSAPTVGAITLEPAGVTGIAAATSFRFDGHATDPNGDSLDYLWEFGDGVTSSDPTPSHLYQTDGTFIVKVTVTDGKLTATNSTSVTVATMGGAWTGTLSPGGGVTLTLQQSANQLSGTLRYSTTGLSKVVLGQVTSARGISLTFEDTTAGKITGTVGNDAKAITGKIEIGGTSVADISVRR